MFAEFEKIIHAIEEGGDALTLEFSRAEYRKLLEAYFGQGVVLDPQLELECLRIPHFYSAFYVYKYATGHFRCRGALPARPQQRIRRG